MRLCGFLLLLTCLFLPWLSAQDQRLEEPADTLYRSNRRYWERCAEWDRDTLLGAAAIVMLGNSITEGGRWEGLLQRKDVANRGIGSDNTYGFLHRMRYVVPLKPSVCFIMGGINDLYAGFSPETILRNMGFILDTLRAHDIVPIVQSTLFAGTRWRNAREKNVLVQGLNVGLRKLCRDRDVRFLDLNALLAPGGMLEDRFTTDGIHLSAQAYNVWAGEIMAILRQTRTSEP